MSQENVEIFRAYHDTIARASREGLDPETTIAKMAEFWDPHVEYDMSESPWLDIGGVYRGIDACRQFWRQWFAAWESLEFDYALVEAGDCVVVLLDTRTRGHSTGIEVNVGKLAFVTTFKDGLMVHNRFYMSQSEALEAAGLSEQDAHAEPS
jgi:ketosteroid isomerase-like protein